MNVEVTARSEKVSEKAKKYAEEKIGRLDRFFDRITSARIVLDSDTESHKAEMVLSAGGGATLVGESTDAQSIYAAIDTALDKLERQLKRHKEKLAERGRKREK